MRKAQGLSITTIIVAAIALIVLVVLIAIFTGRIGVFSAGVGEATNCQSLGGTCQNVCNPPNSERVFGASCEDVGSTAVCCKPPS